MKKSLHPSQEHRSETKPPHILVRRAVGCPDGALDNVAPGRDDRIVSRCCLVVPWLVVGLCPAQVSPPRDENIPTFGTTVVVPFGLTGEIYYLRQGTEWLPKFENMEPVGKVYTKSLNIWPRDFAEGFPGVTNRFEWFAIDYTGRFYIDKPGAYRFALSSDDGSKLYIDDKVAINNDGMHQPETRWATVELSGGIHRIRVSYFQGPRYQVALILEVAGPHERMRIFNTDEFRPPSNPEDWKYGDPSELQVPEDSNAGRRKLELRVVAPPIRALHALVPSHDELALAIRFIRKALPKEGVNLLVLEFGYHYQFTTHPEVADAPALSREDVKALLAACRAAGVTLVPEIGLLGHQSWKEATGGLLRAHPEFDETPDAYPNNEGIYSRSYCPLHPQVHDVVFDLIDELAEACEARNFHAGLNQVFLLGEPQCARCRGKSKAELFAGEVRAIHDHLAAAHRGMMMWGDRLLNGDATGIGKWEASVNGTHPSILEIPKDIVICDWHYQRAFPTAQYFASQGFAVLSAPYADAEVARAQLEMIRQARADAPDNQTAARFAGMLQTTWVSIGRMAAAYYGGSNGPRPDANTKDALSCFRDLFSRLRALTSQ